MNIYNTRSKHVEKFSPIEPKHARMYSCGPTVYDHAHIGNLSSYIYADTLRRILSAAGLEVTHTMNITDVDDKTIRRSLESDHTEEPMTALLEFTREYTERFFEDMAAVGNDINAIGFVRATDHIEHMQVLITDLLERGFAYTSDDGIYFSLRAYREAGKVYGQLLHLTDASTSESRIDNDEYDKESVHDFALWKKRKDNEPYWQFEVNGEEFDGRPGWHIECSAMSAAALGLPFDIHTGGIDLIFPHHENEIAQSTAGSNQSLMANVFFHNEHLLVEGKKMSKSLQNFYTLNDLRTKGIDPLAFRILVLQSHYRSQSNFTWEGLEAASGLLRDIRGWADLRFQSLQSLETSKECKEHLERIQEAAEQDLNTPQAITELISLVKRTAELGADSETIAEILPEIELIFGLNLLNRQDIGATEKSMLNARTKARADKDWQLSDTIRDQLRDAGLEVRDTEQGQIWNRL
jgi:cysteinyl-tRNA synthetase